MGEPDYLLLEIPQHDARIRRRSWVPASILRTC
jgi:hypothetical protein